ncbi:synaptotagmin-like protein 1 isoform X1 [Acipenser ruthenus]|uniref:synaptotagmin-like protein 1 isoform X1 n=2 Tax=Acipenser ruthenus TaxID=7906 RepID=UPI002740F0FA|nr:synaptotagmin-like protein 1 isoform X1 [Acipenser ruthenus]
MQTTAVCLNNRIWKPLLVLCLRSRFEDGQWRGCSVRPGRSAMGLNDCEGPPSPPALRCLDPTVSSREAPTPPHTPAMDPEAPLDLSFLSEEEQSAILEVLLRDSELRSLEEGRISKLRHSVLDPSELKILTGDWFSDMRSTRHQDQKYGPDIVRASIRRKKTPKGEAEQTGSPALQKNKETPSLPDEGNERAAETEGQGENSLSLDTVDKHSPAETEEGEEASQVSAVPEPLNGTADLQESAAFPSRDPEELESVPQPVPTVSVQSQSDPDSLSDSKLDQSNLPPNVPSELPRPLLSSSLSVKSLQSNNSLSGSMMSLFSSGEFGSLEVKGSVLFALHYDGHKGEFQIKVYRCQDLAEAKKQRSDPYVKSYLLPDKSSHSKRKTSVKKKCINPVFDETLKYKITMADLRSRTLNLSVWHHDPLGRNFFLGEVEVAMETWDWSDCQPAWHDLLPRTPMSPECISSRGRISLALQFIPAGSQGSGTPLTGELHFWLKEAQNIIPTKGSSIDTFLKSYVLPDDSKSSHQKTRVVKKSLSPTFNHTMVYDGFQREDLKEACAEFTLWEHQTFSSLLLGGVRLSLGTGFSYGQPVSWMDSTEEEIAAWRAMISQPGTWVDISLPLRTNLVPRSTATEPN